MKHESLTEILKALFDSCIDMVAKKNKTYSSNEDALNNFKAASNMLGMTDYQVWSIYFHKHVSAIFKAIKDDPTRPIDGSEGFRTKIIDAICYLGLLYSLDIDHECDQVIKNVTQEDIDRITDEIVDMQTNCEQGEEQS